MAAAAFLAKISPKQDFNGNHAYFFAERRPERRPSGPAGYLRGFIFFFSGLMNTTQGFQFYPAKISVNTTETIKNINEYQVTKLIKYAWFPLKSRFGDIFAKNAAVVIIY